MTPLHLEYRLVARQVGLFLACLALYFALQSLVVEYLIENVLDATTHFTFIQIIDLFSVNAEQTIPTWYSILLLFGASVLLMNLAAAHHIQRDPDARYWTGLALLFLYLSMDEGAVIHEIAATALQNHFSLTGFLTFGWQLVAVPLVIVFGLLYLRFLFRLPSRTRLLFVVAGVIYAGGALVVEGISANQLSLDGDISFPYLAIATVEEFCEMLGVIVFIYALLSYAAEKQYQFAFIPVYSLAGVPSVDTLSQSAASEPLIVARLSKRLMRGLVAVVITANALLLAWAFMQPLRTALVETAAETPLQTILDQFPDDKVVMTRLDGRFGGDNLPAREVAAALLGLYDDVLVLTLPSMESSVVFAADELLFDRDAITEILHANGITQFVIFETPAVRALVGISN